MGGHEEQEMQEQEKAQQQSRRALPSREEVGEGMMEIWDVVTMCANCIQGRKRPTTTTTVSAAALPSPRHKTQHVSEPGTAAGLEPQHQ